jgi:voltage-gated sodium channel
LAQPLVERIIIALILINAVTLGLETSDSVMAAAGPLLHAIDKVILAVFVVELVAKLVVHRVQFFRDPWNVFDFVVVVIALVPASGPLSVLRALRVLRVLRLITVVPSLKRVVGALLGALPGMGSIVLLLGLIFYVGAVMATKLFGEAHPEQYGDLGTTLFTLFQLMTLDGWSGEIVKPVLATHPYAMLFFVPFILCSAFVALNLFIGVVVNAMQEEVEAGKARAAAERPQPVDPVLEEVQRLRADVARLTRQLERSPAE